MRFSSLFTLFLSFSLLFSFVCSSEILRVLRPPVLAGQFFFNGEVGSIQEKPALFGIPSFQHSIDGVLVHAPQNVDGCSPYVLSESSNALLFQAIKMGRQIILLLERGTCTFIQKVQTAQHLSPFIKSVIVYNNQNELSLKVMNGENPDVRIPSMFISNRDGLKLVNYLESADNAGSPIILKLSYSVPRPDGRVEWDFWAESKENSTDFFRRSIGSAMAKLGDRVLMTPRFYIIDGRGFSCYNSATPECLSRCTNQGRYCANDPENDLSSGYNGQDIVRENLRQICLFRSFSATSAVLMYRYWELLQARCPSPEQWKTEECSYSVIDNMNAGVNSETVKACIRSSGGYGDTSNSNSLLEEELGRIQEYDVFYTPISYVNNVRYYGSTYCPVPVQRASCGILDMICSGFAPGTVPPACDANPNCNFGDLQCSAQLSGDSSSSSSDSSFPVWAVVLLIISLCSVVAGGVYYYQKRQQKRMRADIDQLLRQYLPLEGPSSLVDGSGNGAIQMQTSSRKRIPIPQDEEETM